MSTINYRLRTEKANAKGEAPLALVYQVNRKRSYYATHIWLLPKQWDTGKQRIKSGHPQATALNGYLQRLRAATLQIEAALREKGEPLAAGRITQLLEQQEQPSDTAGGIHLLALMAQFIAHYTPSRQVATLKTYRTLQTHLAAFCGKQDPLLSTVGVDFAEQFAQYLSGVGLARTSAAKQLAILKRMLAWARDTKGYEVAPNVGQIAATRPKNTREYIALTRTDLAAIEAARLPPNRPGLADARDVFLFACYTGLRYSDLVALRPEQLHLDGEKPWLYHVVVKTNEQLRLPLLQLAVAILRRHVGRFPLCALPVVSNQKFNKHIKEVALFAGLTDRIVQVRLVGNKREEASFEKWELVTTHTARRTFATISLELGMQPAIVQRLLGHADIRQTLTYAKLVDESLANEIERVWG